MIKYILLFCGLLLVMAYPWILLFAALYLFWVMLDTDNRVRKSRPAVYPVERKPTHACGRFETGGGKDQSAESFKPGYQDDPEWQKRSAAIRDHIKENKQANKVDVTTDTNAETEPFWTKRR